MLISDRSKEIIENLMNANGPLTVSALSKNCLLYTSDAADD